MNKEVQAALDRAVAGGDTPFDNFKRRTARVLGGFDVELAEEQLRIALETIGPEDELFNPTNVGESQRYEVIRTAFALIQAQRAAMVRRELD